MPDFARFLSLFHWFQLRPGPPSGLYWVLVGIYAVGLGASASYFLKIRLRFGEHAYRLAVARRVGLAGGILCALGLIFVGLRFWGVPYLSLRLWVYMVTIGTVGLGAFLVYYFLRMYPVSLRAYDEEQLRQRYLPRPKAKAVSGVRNRKRKRVR